MPTSHRGGFTSLVETVEDQSPLETGMIGNEGMLGATLTLGVNVAPLQAVVQGSGSALRMSAAAPRRELGKSTALRAVLGRYLFTLAVLLSQRAACMRFHEADRRLARWLLMTHGRADADRFHLTHQFLADMLGERRSAVTIAAGAITTVLDICVPAALGFPTCRVYAAIPKLRRDAN